jgi:hypothetical protein
MATVAVILLAASQARAASITYEYTGELFNFCGFGCPEHAPQDPQGVDYLTATLTFADPLAANLTFADDVSALLLGWTMKNHIGGIDFSSANGDTLTSFPFRLATDGGGNIIGWQIVGTSTESLAAILNPSGFLCPASECGADSYATDFVAVHLFGDDEDEWDSGRASVDPEVVSGSWSVREAPEPTVLTLTGLGLAGLLSRRRSRR